MDSIIFNVRGKYFHVSNDIIDKYNNSILNIMCNTKIGIETDAENNIFIDRCPDLFVRVLKYITDEKKEDIISIELRDELLYYGFLDELLLSNIMKKNYRIEYSFLENSDILSEYKLYKNRLKSGRFHYNLKTNNNNPLSIGIFSCPCQIKMGKYRCALLPNGIPDFWSIKNSYIFSISPTWHYFDLLNKHLLDITRLTIDLILTDEKSLKPRKIIREYKLNDNIVIEIINTTKISRLNDSATIVLPLELEKTIITDFKIYPEYKFVNDEILISLRCLESMII
mgnify:CR=1 FL=1